MERIKDYAHKCHILRQIQSNKAQTFRRINAMQNIATVVVSGFLTFIGFSGVDKIHTYLNWIIQVDKAKVEFAFNFFVFVLFVLVILHLVFQFGRKQADAERAIVSLTNLANQIEDLIAKAEGGYTQVTQADHELIRQKYETLIEVIPPNSDQEFLKAKVDYQSKEAKQTEVQIGPQDLFDESRQKAALLSLVNRAGQLMEILRKLREADQRLYLGGGLVRNLVWDYLHGFRSPTPIDDVDVVYFDKLSSTKDHDREIESRLTNAVPNLRWSVKNQARMNAANSDEPYTSLSDAVSKWPETATAMAVRLGGQGEIEVIAPHGFSDLFRLLVVPTPHFRNRSARISERVTLKQWEKTWPKLRVILDSVG